MLRGAAGEMRLVGWAAICGALDGLGWPMTRFAAARLATRELRPMPVDGPAGRPFSYRSALVEWMAAERRRCNRTALSQLSLFAHGPHAPHDAHDPHNE